jgi:hypothetical protein
MSKSYRRPYLAICGSSSAKKDKQTAARGVRRKQNAWLRDNWHEEEMGTVPHRYECHHNNVWDWCRDGKQRYCVPGPDDWHDHLKVLNNGPFRSQWDEAWHREHDAVWPPEWFRTVTRK